MTIKPVASSTNMPYTHALASKPQKTAPKPMDVIVGQLPADPMPGQNPKGVYFTERHKVIQPNGSSSEYVLIKQDVSSYQSAKNGGARDKTLERINVPSGFAAQFIDNDENGKADRIRFVPADVEPGEDENKAFGVLPAQDYIIAPRRAKGDFMNL
jgi:hypothetical protein